MSALRKSHELIQDAYDLGVTIEDLAYGMAALDGKGEEFEDGKTGDDELGHYEGYFCEMDEIFRLAIRRRLRNKEK